MSWNAEGERVSINTYFTAGHEWLRLEGDIAIVGITAHAAEQLGEIVHVELKTEGTKLRRGDVAGFVESVKAASDVYAPLSGEIIAHNRSVIEEPPLLSRAPENDGWLLRIRIADPEELRDLLDRSAYLALLG
jgi:glycine cleavage system H protein